MTEQERPYSQQPMDDEIDLIDLLKVVYRARWLIVGLTLVAMVAAFLYSNSQERVYEAEGTFAVQADRLRAGTDQRGIETVQVDTRTALTVLNSRQLAEEVVDALGLVEVWEAEDRAAAARRLSGGTNVRESASVITLSFRDQDPVLARDVVAAYIEHFEQRMDRVNVSEADRVLQFVENRLEEVQADMRAAEQALQDFQQSNNITSLSQQSSALVQAHGRLQEQVRDLEVRLAAKGTYLTEFDPEMQGLQAERDALRAQLRALETGAPIPEGSEVAELVDGAGDLALRRIPELSVQLSRLEREVRMQRDMYELLRGQHESARVEASRQLSVVRMIDEPIVPQGPVARGTVMNTAIAGVLGGFVSLFLAFVLHFFRSREWDEETLRELPFLKYFAKQGPGGAGGSGSGSVNR